MTMEVTVTMKVTLYRERPDVENRTSPRSMACGRTWRTTRPRDGDDVEAGHDFGDVGELL